MLPIHALALNPPVGDNSPSTFLQGYGHNARLTLYCACFPVALPQFFSAKTCPGVLASQSTEADWSVMSRKKHVSA